MNEKSSEFLYIFEIFCLLPGVYKYLNGVKTFELTFDQITNIFINVQNCIISYATCFIFGILYYDDYHYLCVLLPKLSFRVFLKDYSKIRPKLDFRYFLGKGGRCSILLYE